MSPADQDPSTKLEKGHKLAPPRAHPGAVERRRLLSILFEEPPTHVAMLQAPAGHGKTSLMIQAADECARRGLACGWLTLDASDDDATRLFDQLLAVTGGMRNVVSSEVSAKPHAGISSRIGLLASDLKALHRPAAIFLDDAHFVTNRSALNLLAEVLRSPLPNIRWFISSRTPLSVGIAELAVASDARILRAHDLRFSGAEASEFFHKTSSSHSLNDTEIATISEITNGWPAAMQLYRLAAASANFSVRELAHHDHGSAELTEYLAKNVLDFQEPEIREFLLVTCVLERMSADLCDAMRANKDSARILDILETRGLFIRRLASEDGWFTYHALFYRFLRDERNRRYPREETDEYQRRAADWYRQRNYYEEALRHYSQCGDHNAAAEVFDLWTEALLPSGYMVTIERWLESIPLQEIERRPGLTAKIIWALTFLSRYERLEPFWPALGKACSGELTDTGDSGAVSADPHLARCVALLMRDRLIESGQPIENIDTFAEEQVTSRFRAFELAGISNIRAYIAMAEGDLDSAFTLAGRGRELSLRCGGTFTRAYSTGITALTLFSQGRLPEARLLLEDAIHDPTSRLEGSLSGGCLVSAYIATLYEANEPEKALDAFDSFKQSLQEGVMHDYAVLAHRAVARILDRQGRPLEALRVLDDAERLARAGQWPRVARLVVLERVRREVLSGHLNRAELIFGNPGGHSPAEDQHIVRLSEQLESNEISLARILIAKGNAERALDVLRPLLRLARRQGRVLRQIKLTILTASARAALGEERAAHRYLANALDLAAPGKCVQGFLDEGLALRRLLEDHLAQRGTDSGGADGSDIDRFLTSLVTGDQSATDSAPSHGSASPVAREHLSLTDREHEMLQMLCRYMTNNEIAQATFVSNDTVKYHLKNIYVKLRAKNRMDAVRIAHELGY